MAVELVRAKIVLLSNPASGYNSLAGMGVIDKLAQENNIAHYKAASMQDIKAALADIAKNKPGIIAINGGDGTADAVINIMRSEALFYPEPRLALLKGGTTNMIHGDCGLKGKPARALYNLIRGNISPVLRQPLKIDRNGKIPLYGFFLGTGAMPRAILHTRKTLHKWRMTGKWGEALAIGLILLKLKLKRDLSKDPLLYPAPVNLKIDNQNRAASFVFLAMTSLKRLILNHAVETPEGNIALVFMRSDRKLAQACGKEFVFDAAEPWVLDGEFFSPENLTVTLGDPVYFLVDSRP